MTPETEPPQPDEIERAIREALAAVEPAADPWWRAGVEESLEE